MVFTRIVPAGEGLHRIPFSDKEGVWYRLPTIETMDKTPDRLNIPELSPEVDADRRKLHRQLLAILFDLKSRKVRQLTDYLVRSMETVPERKMRTLRLKERLSHMPEEIIIEVIHDVFSQTRPGDTSSAHFLMSIVDIFSDMNDMQSQQLLKFYVMCRDRGYTRASVVFVSPEPKKRPFSKYDFVENRDMDYVTLGEKRSLARTRNKDLLDRLIYEPHPLVIKNILENPRMTEQEVLKMVSRRPNNEAILSEIFQNEKWLRSYNIKISMIKNPYTPVGIAMVLLYFLKKQDLKDVFRDHSLHELVKETAGDLLDRSISVM